MKSFIKFISGAALLVMFSLALSSYDSVQPVDDPGNGTIVEVIKGQLWSYNTGCGIVYTDKTTRQFKDGDVHMITLVFTLPEGHCFIEKKSYKFDLGPWVIHVTPSGKLIAKQVNN